MPCHGVERPISEQDYVNARKAWSEGFSLMPDVPGGMFHGCSL